MNTVSKISLHSGRSNYDLCIKPIFQDKKKKAQVSSDAIGQKVKKLLQSDQFTGEPKQVEFLLFTEHQNCTHCSAVGLGHPKKTDKNSYEFRQWLDLVRQSGARLCKSMKASKLKKAFINIDELSKSAPVDGELVSYAFLEGFAMAGYSFEKHRSSSSSKKSKDFQPELSILSKSAKWKEHAQVLNATAESMKVTRDWSNEPSNHATPVILAKQAKALATKHGLKCKILTEADARREKMGLFLGVGQGSDNENRMVVLEYTPKKKSKNQKHVMFVGKGITFDSGGISLKPPMRMEEMKHDMTGAATMMGAILLAAKRKVQNKITAILVFAENMPSGHAIQPGNVITARSGKTVEIINTDAEGRLVLADALDYGQDMKPDVLIDAATLTGAVGIALGKHCTGLMTNDEKLGQMIEEIGYEKWERFWRLPTFSDYSNDIKSPVADIKNATNDRLAGTVIAGTFLKEFVRDGVKWAHMDIAYTGYDVRHLSYNPSVGATGAVVRSLSEIAERFK